MVIYSCSAGRTFLFAGKANRTVKAEDIRAELNRVAGEMQELGETEGWTAEDNEKFERLNDASVELERRLSIAENLERWSTSDTEEVIEDRAIQEEPGYDEVFEKYIRYGSGELSATEKRVLRTGFVPEKKEDRAQTAGGTTAGGYTVPQGMFAALEIGLKAYGGVLMGPVRRLNTADGRSIPIPTIDDSSNTGTLTGENTEITETALVFGQKTLGAYKFTSDLVLASYEFLEDTSIDSSSVIAELLGTRIGRVFAPHLINGSGTSEPEGLDLAANLVTAAGAAAITRADILSVIHAVDPAYRVSDAFRVIFNDATLKAIKALAIGDSDSRPLWQPSMAAGEPATVEGVPYIVDQGCANIGAGLHSVYAADLRQLWVRQAGPFRFMRSDQRYFEYDQVGFIAAARWDSALVETARSVAYLRHPAS